MGCRSETVAPELHDLWVAAGFEVDMVAGPELVDYPMFGRLDETGRLFLFESTGNVYAKTQDAIDTPQFRINLLEDLDGDGIYDRSTIYADSVGFPQGGVYYKGSLYVTSAPDLWKLTDTDGDGVADEKEVLMSGWVLNVNANSLIGPYLAPDGWMYMTSAIEGFDLVTMEGLPMKGETARVWRFQPGGANLEWISAGGMNNPVGLAFTDASEPIGTMTYFTNPKAGERDALIYWTEGGVYPKPNSNISRDGMALTGDLLPVISKYSRVAPSGICSYRSTVLGDDFKGNLFSAQFNTHRILRHQLFREGATFRTEDEVFFSTGNEDFHPTDVLEGGDGSLLVVETGGWFIKGCPLSQVSKPELEGAIYRIRRKDASRMDDPFGNNINWQSLDVAGLVKLLEDQRPFVVDRTIERMVDLGADAVPALGGVIDQSSSVTVRVHAVFTLFRIGTDEALSFVRNALKDSDISVQVAAARSLGLAKDQTSVDPLLEVLKSSEGAAKRQAATALGQIGESRAIAGLLEAAEGNHDRFIEHAIIHSLIILNEPQMVSRSLDHPSPQVRRATLISLDQMSGSPLLASQLTKYLTDPDSVLRNTALWIAPHHPSWAGDILEFLQNQFDDHNLNPEYRDPEKKILVAFCHDLNIQKFIGDEMEKGDASTRQFMLEVMAVCEIDRFPETWISTLRAALANTSITLPEKSEILQLIQLRGIRDLDSQLRDLTDNENQPVEIRISALEVLAGRDSIWEEKDFSFLSSVLKGDEGVRVKLAAAHVLNTRDLNGSQLLVVADELLPDADAFILPRIVPLFEGAHSREVGETLIQSLANSPGLENFSAENIRLVFKEYPPELKPEIDRLIGVLTTAQGERLTYLNQLEKQIVQGDIENGRRIYFGKAICNTCHTVGLEGGTFGPDLTSIQRDRSVHDLLEAIVYPSVSFVREYETYEISTKDATYRGIIAEETPEMILLNTAPETTVRIPVSDMISREMSDISMMPQGLDKILTQQEMADLMAFILGQDQDPDLDEALLR